MNPTDRGRIVLTASIFCGRCQRWHDLDAMRKRSAGEQARQIGYRFTRAEGWVCPACLHVATCPECVGKPTGHGCMKGYELRKTFG